MTASSVSSQITAASNPVSNPVPLQGQAFAQVSTIAQNALQQPYTFFDPASVIPLGNKEIAQPVPTVEQIQAKHLAEQKALREQQIVRQLQVVGLQQNTLRLRDSFRNARNQQHIEPLLDNPFPTIEDTALSLLKTGQELLYADRKYADAIYAFQLAIRNNTLDPDFRASDETNALLHYYMGISYQMLDKVTEADRAYSAALDFKNATAATRAMLYGALAGLHLLKGETELAFYAYKNALNYNSPSDEYNATWSYQLSVIYQQLGQTTEAFIACQNGLQFMHASASTISRLVDLLNLLKQPL